MKFTKHSLYATALAGLILQQSANAMREDPSDSGSSHDEKGQEKEKLEDAPTSASISSFLSSEKKKEEQKETNLEAARARNDSPLKTLPPEVLEKIGRYLDSSTVLDLGRSSEPSDERTTKGLLEGSSKEGEKIEPENEFLRNNAIQNMIRGHVRSFPEIVNVNKEMISLDDKALKAMIEGKIFYSLKIFPLEIQKFLQALTNPNFVNALSQVIILHIRPTERDEVFEAIISNCTSVNTLILEGCSNLRPDTYRILSKFRNLKKLHLAKGKDFQREINQARLQAIVESCPSLVELTIEIPYMLRPLEFKIISNLKKLQVLNLPDSSIDDHSLKLIIENCPHLRKLKLLDCKNLTPESMKALAQLTKLESLDLQGTKLTYEAAEYLVQNCPNLKSFLVPHLYHTGIPQIRDKLRKKFPTRIIQYEVASISY